MTRGTRTGDGTRLSRRGVLKGLGVAMAAPAAIVAVGSSAGAASATTPTATRKAGTSTGADCLADLVQQGVVNRADLMAR